MADHELESLFAGYGYIPHFIEGHEPEVMHQQMAVTLDTVLAQIQEAQHKAGTMGILDRSLWPMIVLRSPKGWTGPAVVDGRPVEGTFRSHQVPLAGLAENPEHLAQLETWMHSYRPEELFDEHAHPIPVEGYAAWAESYVWQRIYDYELLYAGPLFIHQYSHLWIDFRGIQDAYMLGKGSDYFENSRRATLVQREYAIRNPHGFQGYGDCCWGFTACHGPGPAKLEVHGVERHFLDYSARGAPYGPDDGTIATWAVVASLPFVPEVVLPTLHRFKERHVGATGRYGFESTFNPSYPSVNGQQPGWVCPWVYGIDQGALALMIENYRTGLVWERMKRSRWIARRLRRAGFDGGWLRATSTVASKEATS